MYGVPADIPLEPLVGQEVNTFRVGLHQMWIDFLPDGQISIEGSWELHDAGGNLVDRLDRSQDVHSRESFQLHRLLGAKVTHFTVNPPTSFTVFLDSGLAFTVFDDSDQYESFSVHVDGKDIWI